VLDWLRNALFGPRRHEYEHFRDEIYEALDRMEERLKKREGREYVTKRWEENAQNKERLEAAIGEAVVMLQQGKSQKEAFTAVVGKYPDLAIPLAKMAAKMAGLKLPL